MTTTVSARMDERVKQEAEQILDTLGLSHSAVINALYSQIILRRCIPFELSIPTTSAPLTLKRIRDAVRPLAEKYGIKRVLLFGSYARGEATGESDVDLHIDPGEARGMAIGGFQYEVQEQLGIPVDLVTTNGLSPKFLQAIAEDEVVLYER